MENNKYPSIEQYRQCVRELISNIQYMGKDENGNAIYDETKPLPKITFNQTVKVHGTNAGVYIANHT